MKSQVLHSIIFYKALDDILCALPLATQGIRAGFPSPADDYLESSLDLNELIIKDKEATFYGRVQGNSMEDALIYEGDIVVIDRSIEAKTGAIALCHLDGEFTVKTLEFASDHIILKPANVEYNPIIVTQENDFSVWGVVTYIIHKAR